MVKRKSSLIILQSVFKPVSAERNCDCVAAFRLKQELRNNEGLKNKR